ncbi:MAG: hypothetical protein FJ291_12895 [Planctomycetes bacterium]|nr:hypothetical protein [Planctomycetota bacterium]
MFPAARMGDQLTHDLLVPSGLITQGAPTVMIEFLPAAYVTCKCACSGAINQGAVHPPAPPVLPPPDIITGSLTVLICNQPAARWVMSGDMTTCAAQFGLPSLIPIRTTLIGGPPSPFGMGMGGGAPSTPGQQSGTMARATREPTPEQIQEIQDALDAGDQQRAIDLTRQYYGIDLPNTPNVTYNPAERNYGITEFDGSIVLGPAAMSSPAMLASTIVHEGTHSNQAAALRAEDPSRTGWPADSTGGLENADYLEAQAYQSEVNSAHNTGLDDNPSDLALATGPRDTHYGNLSDEQRRSYDQGRFPP